ncbi:MAG: aminodeoxychorismate/anthranilate synthase component II [Myxococcaceae bacterium]|jgi:anthranilate synthase/aminodeoxychorismate synthase-like glutamine amidotransferase|nr:aminodeoxychorismate/anthranilate synthase component II [Myxococcaceae bacterium]MCA3010973.1 aminodeoxychorismate/anthranilate synthase component II [Myxococcaceae bacterium]
MAVLFVENDDSFSFNVLDLLPANTRVVRAAQAAAALPQADVVVIGPGPTDPARAGLVQLAQHTLERRVPLLGICLGHQALGLALGARLVRSTPAHGKAATATASGSRFLPDGRHEVMRYHSLSLVDVPTPLVVSACLDDGTVMAVEHPSRPILGLQFHPDSFGTPLGPSFVEAFFRSLS